VTLPKGSIVIDELILPITNIYLSGRSICLEATVHGPVRAVSSTDYVVCDRQGGVVYRTVGRTRPVEWGAMGPDTHLTVTLLVEMDNYEAHPVPFRRDSA